MDRKELMAQYGELLIQAEILNIKINEVKKQIADEINKKPANPVLEEA
jgi:uncharacterized protein involved in exopolysaccharide biosynthesis